MKNLMIIIFSCIVFSFATHAKNLTNYKLHTSFGELWNDDNRGIEDEKFLGIGGEYFITEKWSTQFNYLNTKAVSDLDYKSYLLGGRYYFNGNAGTSLFLSGDIARVNYPEDKENQIHFGIGINYIINSNIYLTAEMRKVFSENSYNQDAMSLLTLGYRFKTRNAIINRIDSDTVTHGTTPDIEILTKNEPEEEKAIKVSSVSFYFPFDSSKPILVDYNKLKNFLEYASDNNKSIIISGYTDNIGNENYNKNLSKRRAEFIMNKLKMDYSIEDEYLSIFAYGVEFPKGDNSTPEGRAINRRVTLSIQK
ncbi:OmpA family protein [Vibrio metschnikovii]|uniref:OmpA family protein n=1 Tax=Vibrio metschnikovii TaxID=28172 RepID=UPI0016484861|nr:OmpA family protein [Vibrio metschnikovii]MBC3619204.1 OmpA family protein [Vibrio metschnikovii]